MMGKIFMLAGKSASGKDAIYRNILNDSDLRLKKVVPYTTRPMRDRESDGVQYFFRTEEDFFALKKEGKVIESRTYDTKLGLWHYYTADDSQIDLEKGSYLMIGTIEAYKSVQDYYGADAVVPLYIECDDGIRLERALRRERRQERPRYDEMCRRYLSDMEDFSDEKIREADITNIFRNEGTLEECLDKVREVIKKHM